MASREYEEQVGICLQEGAINGEIAFEYNQIQPKRIFSAILVIVSILA